MWTMTAWGSGWERQPHQGCQLGRGRYCTHLTDIVLSSYDANPPISPSWKVLTLILWSDFWVVLCGTSGWTQWFLQVPSNLRYSMILWYSSVVFCCWCLFVCLFVLIKGKLYPSFKNAEYICVGMVCIPVWQEFTYSIFQSSYILPQF